MLIFTSQKKTGQNAVLEALLNEELYQRQEELTQSMSATLRAMPKPSMSWEWLRRNAEHRIFTGE